MAISHHPHDDTLARYAAGTIEAGASVVVATHLALCPRCRRHVADFEAVGAALMDDLPPADLAPDALSRMLGRLDEAEDAPPALGAPPVLPGGLVLPDSLRGSTLGRWRSLTKGTRASRVRLPFKARSTVFILHMEANRKLPLHGHTGAEFTQVLSGHVSDKFGHYAPGDFQETDSEIDHQPRVDADGDCICLIALDGQVRLRGLVGRVMQSFSGF